MAISKITVNCAANMDVTATIFLTIYIPTLIEEISIFNTKLFVENNLKI